MNPPWEMVEQALQLGGGGCQKGYELEGAILPFAFEFQTLDDASVILCTRYYFCTCNHCGDLMIKLSRALEGSEIM